MHVLIRWYWKRYKEKTTFWLWIRRLQNSVQYTSYAYPKLVKIQWKDDFLSASDANIMLKCVPYNRVKITHVHTVNCLPCFREIKQYKKKLMIGKTGQAFLRFFLFTFWLNYFLDTSTVIKMGDISKGVASPLKNI